MQREPIIHRKGFDWITLGIYLSLVIIGVLMQYAVQYTHTSSFSLQNMFATLGKSGMITLIAIGLFYAGYVIEWKFWSTFAYPIYGITLVLLVGVLIFGTSVKGSQSWFNMFGLSIQPAEFAKFGTALAVAAYLSFYRQQIVRLNNLYRGFLLILLPVFLILLQPDAGSALVFLSLIIVFYRAGISIFYLLIPLALLLTFVLSLINGVELVSFLVLLAALLFLSIVYYQKRSLIIGSVPVVMILAYLYYIELSGTAVILAALLFVGLTLYYWFRHQKNSSLFIIPVVLSLILFGVMTHFVFENVLKPHQQDRINVWLRPEMSDPRGALYNIIQSKMAIGSGGLEGKGFLKGTMTNLDYVPEQSTDFIFSTVGEEQGFIGAVSIIFLFLLLILRIILIGERSNNPFILYYSYAVAGYLFIHFFVNIGMTMGLVPVIGIPLPFLSKGGSAMMAFSLMLGVLLKLDVSRRIR
jgi:rod shape determining protein RodA